MDRDALLAIVTPRYKLSFPVPARADMNGTAYTFSTDGHQMIAVESDTPALFDATAKVAHLASALLMPGVRVRLSCLVLAVRDAFGSCDKCNGERRRMRAVMAECSDCEGYGRADCPTCGHDSPCHRCNESGRVATGEAAMQPCECCEMARSSSMTAVSINSGAALNARLILPTLSKLPDPDRVVEVAQNSEYLAVRGDGWIYIASTARADEAKQITLTEQKTE
jgi:hypothetical protein